MLSDVLGVEIRPGDATVLITWHDGHVSTYGWLWLRDCCGCEGCRGDGTRQRLTELHSLPAASRPATVTSRGHELVVLWEPDGHESTYDLSWLRDRCACPEDLPGPARRRSLWRTGFADIPLRRSLREVRTDEAALEAWLAAIAESGIAVLVDAGSAPDTLTSVVELFGYIRETNYGRIFDVVTTVEPDNLAFTSLPLGPHTDNPYRDPVPTLQLLHCLVSSTVGGDSIFVDGLEAASILAAEDRDAFGLLSSLPIPWRYADGSTQLSCEAPVLGLDVNGDLAALRFNERARVPSRLPADVAAAHLCALRKFAEILERPELQLRLRLEPGELVCFDNQRVLHGRTGFDSAGERHLQGCYADRDGLESRLAVLRRRRGPAAPLGEASELLLT